MNKIIQLLCFAGALSLSSALNAASITIGNDSFEDGNADWIFGTNTSTFGVTTSFYANFPTVGDLDGATALYNISSGTTSQTLTDSIVVGDTYTLTVAVGDRDAGGRAGFAGYDIRLQAGGVDLGGTATLQSSTSPGDGTFTDVTLTYTAQAGDSGLLGISIGTFSAGSGKSTDFDNVRLTKGVTPPADAIAISSPVAHQIVQRDGSDQAVLTITGTYTGSPTEIRARATAINGNGTDTAWIVIDSSPSANAYAGSFTLDTGWYLLETRSYDGLTELVSTSLNEVGVGDIFITTGQSNAANFGQSTQSADDDRVSYYSVANGWKHGDDLPSNPSGFSGEGGSPWPELGDLLSAASDVPTAFVSIARGSSDVNSWTTGNNYSNLKNAVQAFGVNGFKAILWHQGEKDNGLNTSTADYKSRLETAIAASRTDAGWAVPWFVALCSYNGGVDTNIINGQLSVIADDANVHLGASTDALIGNNPASGLAWRYGGGVHFSNEGLNAHAQLWFDALADVYYTSAENWRLIYFDSIHDTGNAADDFDADQDGLNNLVERSFGTLPTDASSYSRPSTSFSDINGDPGAEYISFSYVRLSGGATPTGNDYTAQGITYAVQHSADLSPPWVATDFIETSVSPAVDGLETATFRLDIPLSRSDKNFLRLSLIQN